MRRGLIFGISSFLVTALAIFFVLSSPKALLIHPKGLLAKRELHAMITQAILMLIVIIPTFVALFLVAWRYRSKNRATYTPDSKGSVFSQLLLWLIPTPIIGLLMVFTWNITHELDPYVPIKSDKTPLTIQVMALNWKWLFIYPEQRIATLNFVQFPAKRPIHFSLAADDSPMNSFWIPQLSGQIYCMAGMVTPLPLMAQEEGEYTGRAVEINGEGYAGMTFVAHASSENEFEKWVALVQSSSQHLTETAYQELLLPSENHPVTLYSQVEDQLFEKMVMKYMHPPKNMSGS